MPDNTENNADKAKTDSFESAMAELGRLVAQLEEGELPLEASISAYQRGVELVRYCTAQLEKVDKQIEVLDKEMLKPFQPDNPTESK
ncbi:MAG: exodeoxyribonuclease VII small subunit [Betaproteobacteria bacterium]|nr:exodeoxyribonuclease VII small subunit [Betaproteobacteria bacterium]